jgi:hypothetical protein
VERASEAGSLRIAKGSRLSALLALAAVPVAIVGCGGSSDTVSSGTKPLDTVTNTGQQPAPPSPEESAGQPASKPATSSVPRAPEKAIKGAVRAVLAPQPPGPASARTACGLFVTDRYLQTTYGTRQGCIRALVPGSAADSVMVGRVIVDGNRATARAVPRGGPSSGETITVRLVRAGDNWEVDSLRSDAPVGP